MTRRSRARWRRGACADRGLPGAHAPGVDVHEVRRRVVADAAGPERERGLAQRGKLHVAQADVDRLALQVQAAAGDAELRWRSIAFVAGER